MRSIGNSSLCCPLSKNVCTAIPLIVTYATDFRPQAIKLRKKVNCFSSKKEQVKVTCICELQYRVVVLESCHNLYHISAVDILFLLSFCEHTDMCSCYRYQKLCVARSELKVIKINIFVIFRVFLVSLIAYVYTNSFALRL
jgi:hypothetical protein